MKASKKSRPLPTRGGLNDLDKSERRLGDYSKAVPTLPSIAKPGGLKSPRKGA